MRSSASMVIEPPPDGGMAAWMVVLSTHLVMMDSWGMVNSFGVFQSYYMTLLDRPPEDISWIGSLEVFLLFFIGSFTGRLTDAGYFRPLYIGGTILVCIGTFTASWCTKYWQFILAQGICVGLGNGLLFTPCMTITATYFAKKRSLAFGITAAGSTTGGLIFPSMVRQLLPTVGLGWTLRSIGFIQLVTLIFAGYFMKPRLPPRNSGPLIELRAFKELDYTFYAIGAFMAFWSTYFAFHYVAAFSRDILGLSYPSSLDLVLVLNGVGGPGRVIPGYIGDKIGPVNVYMLCTLITGITMFCWAAVKSVSGMYAWTVVYGFVVGGVQSVFPSGLTSLTEDPRKQGTRMGMVCTIVSFATLTGSPISGAIINFQGGHYLGAQMFAGTAMLLAAVFVFSARLVKTRRQGFGIVSGAKV
ncbi:major facilitator superfamily transporter [Thelonectria olida]|uniref:Major facilitator superfamily transporter n=1 Tax=Thelonectria olida TaxID=1576542 RepID=A0A9P9AS81_9HYPO|nr:major facilitator superfamily transporter [Thelonectria olida]